jgi:hypothetical protein
VLTLVVLPGFDVHGLSHTFGTLLSKGNIAPRTAQAAMRRSSLDLTMNVYTDPKLLEVVGALEKLPELGVEGPRQAERRVTPSTLQQRV